MNEITKASKWIGTSPVRPDGVPKVTGHARFGDDFQLTGMLQSKVLRSPHAHARIRSIDTSKAEAVPGVKAVITGADFPELPFHFSLADRVGRPADRQREHRVPIAHRLR
jgi:CO/xanthine dehydrogenase Mo-binding subunit